MAAPYAVMSGVFPAHHGSLLGGAREHALPMLTRFGTNEVVQEYLHPPKAGQARRDRLRPPSVQEVWAKSAIHKADRGYSVRGDGVGPSALRGSEDRTHLTGRWVLHFAQNEPGGQLLLGHHLLCGWRSGREVPGASRDCTDPRVARAVVANARYSGQKVGWPRQLYISLGDRHVGRGAGVTGSAPDQACPARARPLERASPECYYWSTRPDGYQQRVGPLDGSGAEAYDRGLTRHDFAAPGAILKRFQIVVSHRR